MRLAKSDIVQSKACLKSEYLAVFVFKRNAALNDIWLSPNGLRSRIPSAAFALPTKTFQVFARQSRLAEGLLEHNETHGGL